MSEQEDVVEEQTEDELVETDVLESVPADFVSLLDAEETIAEEGIVPVRIIRPGWGSSGYYSTELLRTVAEEGGFDNAHMHWDHINRSERPERSLNNWAGVVVEGSTEYKQNGAEGPGVYGRAYVFPHWRSAVESMRSHLGLSIVGKGQTKYGKAEGRDGQLFQALSVKDVDFVTRPGAGGKISSQFAGFRERTAPQESTTNESESDMTESARVPEINVEEIVREALERSDAKWEERFKSLEQDSKRNIMISQARSVVESSSLPVNAQSRVIGMLTSDVRIDDDDFDATQAAREAVEAELKYIESFTPVHLRRPKIEEAMNEEKYEESFTDAMNSIYGDYTSEEE